MEGMLRKKSSWFGRMDARFFRLEANVLFYWERKGDADAGQEPKGKFVVGPESGLKHLNDLPSSFALRVSNQELTLQAENDAERSQWMSCLNKLICNVSTAHSRGSKAAARKARRDKVAAKYGLGKK